MKKEFYLLDDTPNKEDRNKAFKICNTSKKRHKYLWEVCLLQTLDPPLHEFLPKSEKEIEDVSKALQISQKEVISRIDELHEQNPMLGHRGCRLGISFPEIYEMQCKAIFEALIECKNHKKKLILPEIMIPLVSTEEEINI